MVNHTQSPFYPYGLRYIPDKDDKGNFSEEGIEEYNIESNVSIHSKLRRHSGTMYFTMKDLLFKSHFSSSSTTDGREVSQREYCYSNGAKFSTILDKHFLSSLSFLGTDRRLKDIKVIIKQTDDDDDVKFLSISDLSFIDDMFSDDEYFAIEITIQTSFFNKIKELAFSEKLDTLTLSIEGHNINGLYKSLDDFDGGSGADVRILGKLDMIENKEDMPDTYNDHNTVEPSKNFSLSYTTRKISFEADEADESNE